MREFLFSLLVVCAWVAGWLVVDDYMALRNQVAMFTAAEPLQLRAEAPKWTDAAIVALTFALAVATMGLFLDARAKGRKELRAYVGIKDQGIRFLAIGRFQAFITVDNSGRTPAHELRISLHVGIGNDDAPDGGFMESAPVGRMPLGPNAERFVRQVLWDLQQEDVGRIAVVGHDRCAFVWGRIDYRDIFGARHQLRYRFITREVIQEVSVDEQGRQRARTVGWALQPTEEGNAST